MNNLIDVISAISAKRINVTIVTKGGNTYTAYVYNCNTNSCVVTKDYIEEFIKPRDYDDRFETIKYDDVVYIKVVA